MMAKKEQRIEHWPLEPDAAPVKLVKEA